MRLEITTLVDITQTNEKRGGEPKRYSQQSNYNTVIQCATLRTNLIPTSVEKKHGGIAQLGFGTKFRDRQKYWIATFEAERESHGLTELALLDDFDLVPILLHLEESAKMQDAIFVTKDTERKNIVFKLI